MPRLGYICALCNTFNRGTDPCEACAVEPGFNRPRYSGTQIGMIDGPTSGYFGKKFPRDPKNPAKHVINNKHEWKEHCKRNQIEDIS